MRHTVRIAIVVAMAAAAGAAVSARVPAHAVDGLQTGYWWQAQPAGAPLPAPPTVPANGMWVSGSELNPVAISAIHFEVSPDEAAPLLTAKVQSAFPPVQVSSAANALQIVVMACPATPGWAPAKAGAWTAKPKYDCAGAVTGTLSPDGTTLSIDLGGVVKDGAVDVALVPGTGAAVLPQLPVPVPGAPPTPQPSGFDLTLQPVTADQIHTSPAIASGTSGGAAPAAAAAPDTAASTEVGATANLGGLSAPDYNFAANAVQPSAGVGASSTPPVAPASLAPQTSGFVDTAVKDNKGYRALAVILLAVLLWWAWRQAVPPKPSRRTIYDGPSTSAA
ncbi:MAG: hypothetical protein JO086_03310 [Acidimicrobiia bacterium]|nr:hypothetical protein [Acidimicrobiia bacterium]